PNPANCRIVHNRPRYIDPYTPRVNGNSPGNPTGSSDPPIPPGRSSSVYNGRTGSPDIVENGASRSGNRENVSRSHRCTPVNRDRVAIASKSTSRPAMSRDTGPIATFATSTAPFGRRACDTRRNRWVQGVHTGEGADRASQPRVGRCGDRVDRRAGRHRLRGDTAPG